MRELFGYTRIESPAVIERMNRFYKDHWQDPHNYYLPQTQTLEKKRVGAKIKRKLSKPITPCERLIASDQVSEAVKGKLVEENMKINPWTLKTELRLAMSKLWRHFVINNRWTQEDYNVG